MKTLTGHVSGFPESEAIDPAALLALECDILVPAALENAITAENARMRERQDHRRSRQRASSLRLLTESSRAEEHS